MYNFINGFGVFAEDISEDLIEVILLAGLLEVVVLNSFNKTISCDPIAPVIPVNFLP